MDNIQDYLESGLVEQYALGELAPAERAAVEAQAAAHPAVAAALADAVAALDGYALAHAVTPPPALRARVLGAVRAQIAADAVAPAVAPVAVVTAPVVPVAVASVSDASATAPAVAMPVAADSGAAASAAAAASVAVPAFPAGSVAVPAASLRADVDALARPAASAPPLGQRPAPASADTGRSWLAVAASVALLLSVLGNFFLYSRWRAADTDLVALQADQTRLASANTVLQRELGGVKSQNDILRDDRLKVVALAGTPDAPGARARVFFDPVTRRVFLDARHMPALPAGRQYQLWALHNGKPVDAGLVAATTAATGLQKMKETAAAQAFAVTVEPTGGSANPTMPIRAMGAVAI